MFNNEVRERNTHANGVSLTTNVKSSTYNKCCHRSPFQCCLDWGIFEPDLIVHFAAEQTWNMPF